MFFQKGESVMSTALIVSLVGSAPWIVGLVISGVAWRRRRSVGLKLALSAFAGLIALGVIGSNVHMPLTDLLIDAGLNVGTITRTLDGVSLIFQLGHTGLVILLAIALSRLLQENHEAIEDR